MTLPKDKDIQPPRALDAERAILGSILKKPDLIRPITARLRDPLCFYEPKHRLIYRAMQMVANHGQLPDLTTVVSELQLEGKLPIVGGRVYLIECIENVASTTNHMQWVDVVLERWKYRKIISISNELVSSAYSQELTAAQLVGEVVPIIVQTVVETQERGFTRVGKLVPAVLEELDGIQRGDRDYGIPSGFKRLDELTGGFSNGDLIVVGGRPRWGKTALLMNMAERMVMAGKKVAMVSAETNAPEFVTRLLCTTGEVDSLKARTGKMTDDDWNKVLGASKIVEPWDFYVDDTPEIEIDTLCARTAQLKQDEGVDIILVDYLTKLTTSRKFDARRLAVGYIVSQLKTLAKTLDIPVVVAAQLNRMIETRGGRSWKAKRPTLADLKETGSIEEDADLVMAIFRPELYISKSNKDYDKYVNLAEIILLKQRKGPIGEFWLKFLPTITKYEEMMYHPDDMPF